MRRSVAFAAALLAVGSGGASADALIDAVRAADGQEAIRLIEAGVDVNAADSLGTTPLMWAARYGDAAIVDRLLRRGG